MHFGLKHNTRYQTQDHDIYFANSLNLFFRATTSTTKCSIKHCSTHGDERIERLL